MSIRRNIGICLAYGVLGLSLCLGVGSADAADVIFAPGTSQAIAVDDLDVDGTTYDVTFTALTTADQVYGACPGTYEFSRLGAQKASDALNDALNGESTASVAAEGETGQERYVVGFACGEPAGIETLVFWLTELTIDDGWDRFFEQDTIPYNTDQRVFATFQEVGGAPPEISLTTSSIDWAVLQGNDTATDFGVSNSGGGTLVYGVSDDADWLTLDPANGESTGETDTIAVNFESAGLDPDLYSATIMVSDGAASNSPQAINVTLVVAPEVPAIVLSTQVLTPQTETGSNAPDDSFTVTNGGAGTLDYDVVEETSWLEVDPLTGAAGSGESDTINVTYTTSGLAAGQYEATISVVDPSAINTPQEIAVTLTVSDPQLGRLKNEPVECEAIGSGRLCFPNDPKPALSQAFTIASDQDPLFYVVSDETSVIVTFFSTPASSLVDTGFRISGYETEPDLLVEIADVEYSFGTVPTAGPTVTNTGLPNNEATIEWADLDGAAPVEGDSATIHLTFIPEPSSAALAVAALTTVGLLGRASRRRRS